MRALIQRVEKASVTVEKEIVGKIDQGLVILLGIKHDDDDNDLEYIIKKVVNLRIFEDVDGRFNLSALDVGAQLLVVSQFTLYGDTRRGRRPSFTDAAHPDLSKPMYHKATKMFGETGLKVQEGIFGAHMMVEIHNDGPVTLMLDSDERR